MANSLKGFTPVRYLSGACWNGAATMYAVDSTDATAIGIGDLVNLDGSADPNGIRQVTQADASEALVGVVVGVKVTPDGVGSGKFLGSGASPNLDVTVYVPATKTRDYYLMVVDDPNVLFECGEDADTAPLALADVGRNVNIIASAASATTGRSTMVIDSSTVDTTNTLPLALVEFVQKEDNPTSNVSTASLGSSLLCRWLVRINNHQNNSATGSTGV